MSVTALEDLKLVIGDGGNGCVDTGKYHELVGCSFSSAFMIGCGMNQRVKAKYSVAMGCLLVERSNKVVD